MDVRSMATLVDNKADNDEPLGIIFLNTTAIGKISLLWEIAVEAREIVDVDRKSVRYILLVAITSSGDHPNTSVATIAYEEIDKIAFAIDRIKDTTKSITKFDSFEAQFFTKGEIKIVIFNAQNGSIMAGISHGRATAFCRGVIDLVKFRSLLLSGKQYIEEKKISPIDE